MSLNKKSDIDVALQDRIASTSNIRTDTLGRMRIMNRVFQEMQIYANWLWTIRQTTFDYYSATEEYLISDIDISDFKDVFKIEGQPLHNPLTLEQGIAKKMIDGAYILMLNLGISDKVGVDFEYFSTNMVKSSEGILKEGFTEADDVLLAPNDVIPLFVEWCLVELFKNTKKIDKQTIGNAEDRLSDLRASTFKKYGFAIVKGSKPINIAR